MMPKSHRYEYGVTCALILIKENDKETIIRNYEHSRTAPDQDDFDKGYQFTIKEWLRKQ